MRQHTKALPCGICGGHRDMAQGHGTRCWGFTSDDGAFVHCTREESAGELTRGKDQTFVHRMSGRCGCGDVHGETVRSIGSAAREIVATYDYNDVNGKLMFQVVRFHPKSFRQRRPNDAGGWLWNLDGVRPTLYRLLDVIAAVGAGDTVYIVEGEKDVDALTKLSYIATCNPGGAGKWHDSFARYFKNANVIIVRDKDEPGTKHARQVFSSLRSVVSSIRVVEAREGKDTSDHLAAGHDVSKFVPVWPTEDLRVVDPVAWKRRVLRMSFDTTEPIREVDPMVALNRPSEPRWPTGLDGTPSDRLPNFRGVVIVAGVPSSGKSYLALGSGISAALAGWDVVYLSSEMAERPFAKRLMAYSETGRPEHFHHVDVGYGASIESLLSWIEVRISERPTLTIFDSVTSFIDQAEETDPNDSYGTASLKRLIMWAINVRRITDGQLAFMLLAEANREGRIRGRTGDHKADIALLMESDDKLNSTKRITVTKAWEYETGLVGEYGLDPSRARLVRL